MQYELLDFCTLAVCIAYILARPSLELHSEPRPKKLLSSPVLAPMGLFAALYAIQQGIGQLLIKHMCVPQPAHCKVWELHC